jgi:phage/plasmid primase-like uncharacterized protein
MNSIGYKVEVRDLARGRWHIILPALGINAEHLRNHHMRCPGCGGTDRFRWDDKDGSGSFYCGGGGEPVYGDGFALLSHVHGWDFKTCAEHVRSVLGVESETVIPTPRVAVSRKKSKPDTASTETRSLRAIKLATPAPDNHAYLVSKAIQPHGVGVLGGQYKDLPSPVRNRGNVLVIPIANINGEILSCQFIAEDGTKGYMAGRKRKGGFFYIKGGDRLWVCEGFATGASLHQDTGDSVACAFDTGGLLPVTEALTGLYGKSREIVIMSDDDWRTDGNPGLAKATKASEACGVKVMMPDFTGLLRNSKDTDYNDLARLRHG